MSAQHESSQSIISYGFAGFSSLAAINLESMAGTAEQLTLILACAVVAVRLVYDVTRYVKYITEDKPKKED